MVCSCETDLQTFSDQMQRFVHDLSARFAEQKDTLSVFNSSQIFDSTRRSSPIYQKNAALQGGQIVTLSLPCAFANAFPWNEHVVLHNWQ